MATRGAMKRVLQSLIVLGTVTHVVIGQDIDWKAVEILPTPSYSIDTTATAQTISYTQTAALASISALATDTPATRKRTVQKFEKRTDDCCAPQPLGSGPVPSPDTASAFLADTDFAAAASAAPVPHGYTNTFTNLQASNNAYGYMGFTTLSSYDSQQCANNCGAINGCMAFNICMYMDCSSLGVC
jgi:hypothetical protein